VIPIIDIVSFILFCLGFVICVKSFYKLNSYIIPKTQVLQRTLVLCATSCAVFGFYYEASKFFVDFGIIRYNIERFSTKTTPTWFKAGFNIGVFFGVLAMMEGKLFIKKS
jgi:hypothetical protein